MLNNFLEYTGVPFSANELMLNENSIRLNDFMYNDKMAFDFMHSDFQPLRLYALRQLLASPAGLNDF